jgi:hypothetical protein
MITTNEIPGIVVAPPDPRNFEVTIEGGKLRCEQSIWEMNIS